MAEQNQEDFEVEIPGEERKTPEQIRAEQINAAKQQTASESKGKPDVDIEVEDDTPPEDRNRNPLPKEIVQELEDDELEEYSDKVKVRLRQMKKVWHDERRAKEEADRERAEALALAQKLVEENKKLRGTVNERDTALVSSYKETAARNLEMAKREYREAYESGDTDRIVEAQEKLTSAKIKADQAERFKPTPLQVPETPVNVEPSVKAPPPDPKVNAWHERNQWFGQNRVMTSLALGLHEDLVAERGLAYATTDEYYNRIDTMMREKFPEYFREEVKTSDGGGKPVQRTESKPANVVAPASRSTSPKKIVLKQSQVNMAKRLGITPEQYAKEFMKLENTNG
jgi:hypothetical protein